MRVTAALLVLMFGAGPVEAQRARRTRQPTDSVGIYNLPAVTFHGALKEITHDAIILDGEEGQSVTIYRNHKTRFLKRDAAVDPKTIAIGTKLTLDVAKNPDGSLLAVNVVAP